MYAPAARYCTYKQGENLLQANYIIALAVSALPFFEPAKPITLGELFVTLGESFFFLFRLFSM
jgi:hypothetical protein